MIGTHKWSKQTQEYNYAPGGYIVHVHTYCMYNTYERGE